MAQPKKTEAPIDIEVIRISREVLRVRIVGTAPLIFEKWTHKALVQMEEKHAHKAKAKTPRNPDEEWREYLYLLPDGTLGFPASAFKAAIITGARYFDKAVPMVTLKSAVYVNGEGPDMLVHIEALSGEPECWRHPVRNSSGVADLRYRPRLEKWAATLTITYAHPPLTEGLIVNLLDAGGMGGIGGWRPSSPKSLTGTFGTFHVDHEENK